MRNVTLSADERLIDLARSKAARERSTLNERFRQWLAQYVGEGPGSNYRQVMKNLRNVRAGRKFSRDPANRRTVV